MINRKTLKRSIIKKLAKKYPTLSALPFSSKRELSKTEIRHFNQHSEIRLGLPRVSSYISAVVPPDETNKMVLMDQKKRAKLSRLSTMAKRKAQLSRGMFKSATVSQIKVGSVKRKKQKPREEL